jgi:2-oxoglutarate ferredoxin oxidoreductase subunit gamma
VERELLLTGIGGQGVQLGAQILARAAVLEGREVMLFGVYGGAMRGGNTDSTVVVSDAPIQAPPIVSQAWSAVVMHHEFWEPIRAKLRPGGPVLVNATLFEGEIDSDAHQVVEVPASRIAADVGNPLGGSLVAVGAYAAATGLVGIDSLVEAMERALPERRRQHAEGNARALRAGFDAVPPDCAPAWRAEG